VADCWAMVWLVVASHAPGQGQQPYVNPYAHRTRTQRSAAKRIYPAQMPLGGSGAAVSRRVEGVPTVELARDLTRSTVSLRGACPGLRGPRVLAACLSARAVQAFIGEAADASRVLTIIDSMVVIAWLVIGLILRMLRDTRALAAFCG
jgi:hypothetical protein